MDREDFRTLLSPLGQQLLARIGEATGGALDADIDPLPLATRLRRDYPPSLVAVALTQFRLRARARERFGADAAHMYFTTDGLEQATRSSVAIHRAARYRALRDKSPGTLHTIDLCCGIGGDLIALARAGCLVNGVDRDGLTVDVARANIDALGLSDHAAVHQGDVETIDAATVAAYDAAYCDPSRRAGHGRIFDPAAYAPPLGQAAELVRSVAGGGLKVAPGIPHDAVPAEAEAEWVSDGGEVKEAALWLGGLSSGTARRATLLPSGATLVRDPDLGDPPVAPPQRYLYEPDGAVLRAGLVAEVAAAVDGALVDPTIAYVTSERRTSTPYTKMYEITDVLPFSLKRLRALLRQRRVGTVTIKKRGSAVDVERLRRDLRLSGPYSATIILTRVAGAPYALLCAPLPS